MTPEIIPFARPLNGGTGHIYLWTVENPVGVIQILHGMAEHMERYGEFAEEMNRLGWVVAGHNHRGHGKEADQDHLGYFAKEHGWDRVLQDAYEVTGHLKYRFPGKKIVLYGHSMGSFAAREYAIRYGKELGGLVLSGTGWHPKMLCLAGLCLAKLSKKDVPCKLVDSIAFSGNNKPFEPARTAVDWLSRDEKKVDEYIADPLCGFQFTGQAFCDMFGGLLSLSKTDRLRKMPKALPTLFVSGASDPVGSMGKGVETVAKQFQDAGMQSVTLKLFEGARHEMHNETNRSELFACLDEWLAANIKG